MLLLLLALGVASADDESEREDEMFGGSEDADSDDDDDDSEDSAEGEAPTDRDSAVLGDDLTTNADIFDRLDRADERLTLGGQLWLRLDASDNESTDKLKKVPLSSSNFLDLFADARPNHRVRAYTNARLYHDWTVTDGELDEYGVEQVQSSVVLDQLWIKFDAWRRVYVTAGRQRIKWGAGRFWNPTDFMNQQRLDPLAVFDMRTGVSLLKLHVPVGDANLYAVANFDDADQVNRIGGAVRAEVLVGTTEMSASAAFRKNTADRLGADLSTGIWVFDLHVEGAVMHDVTDPFFEGGFDIDTFSFPEEVDRSEDWIPQVVAGAEVEIRYNDEDTVYLGVEGFHNDASREDPDLFLWNMASGTYTPFYMGRTYVAAYALLMGPGRGHWDDTSFTLSWIGNLSDETSVLRFDASILALTYCSLNAYVSGYMGDQGEFHYGATIPGFVFEQDEDIVLAAPTVDVGVGARVQF